MAKAYKCDLCGKYVDNVYEIKGFDYYIRTPEKAEEFGLIPKYSEQKVCINEICTDCNRELRIHVEEQFKIKRGLKQV